MFLFAGGGKKDADDVTPDKFLPAWWFEDDGGSPEEQTKEAKMAKISKMFESLGGRPVGR